MAHGQSRPGNISQLLQLRELGGSGPLRGGAKSSVQKGLDSWAEADFLHFCSANYADFHPAPRSTIAASFSRDGTRVASTHGDHSVKIVDCWTGKPIRVLEGHRRTPWVVSFHPTNPDILASGSLDHRVCIARVSTGEIIRTHDFGKPIASLAFHPSGDLMVVASGHKVFLWDYLKPSKSGNDAAPIIILKTKKSLRAVHFRPNGQNLLLTAEVMDRRSAQEEAERAAAAAATTATAAASSSSGISAPARGGWLEDPRLHSGQLLTSVNRWGNCPSEAVAAAAAAAGTSASFPTQSLANLQPSHVEWDVPSNPWLGISLPTGQGFCSMPSNPGNDLPSIPYTATTAEQQRVFPMRQQLELSNLGGLMDQHMHMPGESQNGSAAATQLIQQMWRENAGQRLPDNVGPSQILGSSPATMQLPVESPPTLPMPAPWSAETRPPMLGRNALTLLDRQAATRMMLDHQLDADISAGGPRHAAAVEAASAAAAAAAHQLQQELPCLVHLNLWDYDAMAQASAPMGSAEMLSRSKLNLMGVVLCSEMGANFSACGKYLVLCVASNTRSQASIEWHRERIRHAAAQQAMQHVEALRAQRRQQMLDEAEEEREVQLRTSAAAGLAFANGTPSGHSMDASSPSARPSPGTSNSDTSNGPSFYMGGGLQECGSSPRYGHARSRASAGASRRLAENGSINCPAALEALLSSLPLTDVGSVGSRRTTREHTLGASGLLPESWSEAGEFGCQRGHHMGSTGGSVPVGFDESSPDSAREAPRGGLRRQLEIGSDEGPWKNVPSNPPSGVQMGGYVEAAAAVLDGDLAAAGGIWGASCPHDSSPAVSVSASEGTASASVHVVAFSKAEAVQQAEAEALFLRLGDDLRQRLEKEEMRKLDAVMELEFAAADAAGVPRAGAPTSKSTLDVTRQLHYELRLYSLDGANFGQILRARPIHAAHCITSVQLSPTADHILVAFGRRHVSLCSLVVNGGTLVPVHTIIEVYSAKDMSLVRVLPNLTDEVNVACFHPLPGGGIVYGTKEGKLRMLKHDRRQLSHPSMSSAASRIDDELATAEMEESQSHSNSEDESAAGGGLLRLDMTGQYIQGVVRNEEHWTQLYRRSSSSAPGTYGM